jgi:hypothetical protein
MDRKKLIDQKIEIEHSEAKDLNAKLTSSLLPGGAKAYDLFTALVQPLHIQRKQEWLYLLMNDLVRREKDGLTSLKDLSENEEFITIITKATILAQQNHQREKLEAFQNIVLNSIEWLSKGEPIFDWSHKFLIVVDQISPFHILLLKTLQNPLKIAKEKKVDFNEMIKATNKEVFFKIYPKLKDRAALAKQCWKELYSYGFVVTDRFTEVTGSTELGYMHSHGKLISQTTDFGNKFLNMITMKA